MNYIFCANHSSMFAVGAETYENASHIAVRYRLDGKALSITDLRINGRSKPGTVHFFNSATCRADR